MVRATALICGISVGCAGFGIGTEEQQIGGMFAALFVVFAITYRR